MNREANVGGILGETFALLGDASRSVLLYVAAIGGLNALGFAFGLAKPANRLIYYQVGYRFNPASPAAESLFGLVVAVVGVVGAYWLITRFLAARGRYHGGPTRFWAYLGMGILSIIAIMFGLILLIVPGLILLVRWSAASGFVVGSPRGVTESLSASWQATRGHGWSIFAAGLLLFVGISIVGAVIGAATGAISMTVNGVVAVFVQAFAGAATIALGIAIYGLVHDDTRELGEVFA